MKPIISVLALTLVTLSSARGADTIPPPGDAVAARARVIQLPGGSVTVPLKKVPDAERARVFEGTGPGVQTFELPPDIHFPGGLHTLRDVLTPAKRQGNRGSCSAFVAVALLESHSKHDLSEQCLAKQSWNTDAGFLDLRLEWALENHVYKEKDCPYSPNDRDALPWDIKKKTRYKVSGQVRKKLPSEGKALAFIRSQIDQGAPVGGSIYVVGNWWDQNAWAPWTSAKPYARIDIPVHSSLEGFDVTQAWSHPGLQARFKKYFFDAYPGVVKQLQYRGSDGHWSFYNPKKDFAMYLKHLGPAPVPSNGEIASSCPGGDCGVHAITFTGYDDKTRTLQFKNSWGELWKHDGYGYLSYDYFLRFHVGENYLVSFDNL